MTGLFLSRARLRREAPVAAFARLLVPEEIGPQAAAAHQLVWALFSDGADRRRDFLWRQDRPGQFLALSSRPPNPLNDIFDLETKSFAPDLAVGDRLGFVLHANPVIARQTAPGQRGQRHDVVMDALRQHPPGEARAAARHEVMLVAGRAWLARQGAAHGFSLPGDVAVDGYETIRITRPGTAALRFGVLDFEGILTVTDPAALLTAIGTGFGRARAFGCGLMLIRRVP